MSCCTPAGYRTVFGTDMAERDARRYRKKGLRGSARWLADRLADRGVRGRSVLEIGGGIGDIQVELVRAGAAHATNIEIIDTYEETARALMVEAGLDGRMDRRIAVVGVQPDDAPTADIVVLHRVICCYPDPDALLAAACSHSCDSVAITIPRESWWNRLGVGAANMWFRLRRIEFRVYAHPIAPMLKLAASYGFRSTDNQRGRVWESIILVRA
jgi:2-polyprenyl-3-methyl-5-hydroxy-6-metoxy-1,4-benzoquinol methylase